MPRHTPPLQNRSPRLRLYLLGAFRLELNETPIHLTRRKVAALLAYLALHPQAHTREQLAALLWGDTTDQQARTSLRTALVTLRRELGDDIVVTDRDTVQLNPTFPLWVDAREFEQRTIPAQPFASAELLNADSTELTALYRGQLLADFYDDWVLAERERYRGLYLDALLHLVQAYRSQSEYERAIEFAQKVLTIDPANERAHQHLMFCYLARGNRKAALEQYDKSVTALREELAIEPSPETTALYHWIKQTPIATPALAARLTNLPMPLTSFVGRTRESREIKERLATTRFFTLTGVGGTGKTRLAIQVATDLIDAFHDGVWWVELAALGEAPRVPEQVAKALGVRESPNETLTVTLGNHLRDKHLLLALDNCEHLIGACARLANDLLTQCPQLKILATSREPLNVAGEVRWQVPTLAVPTAQPVSLQRLALSFEGVRLFVERAQSVRSDFALTDQNALAIAQICQRLDGIPLALELAAARVNVLSPEQLARRLDDRFTLLTHGSRTALPRQQTLRALIDWSYDLLSEPERILFARLSVFEGGWTLDAAEKVCAEHPLKRPDILATLGQLVDKSLVVFASNDTGSRYHMLETIREYAQEKLAGMGETHTLRARHLEFFLHLAQEVTPLLQADASRASWLQRIDLNYDNLRAALGWALRGGDRRQALNLANALYWYWNDRNYLVEGLRWLNEVLAATTDLDAEMPTARAHALTGAGTFVRFTGDISIARALLTKAVARWRSLGDPAKPQLANALNQLSYVLHDHGDVASALALVRESETIIRQLGDRVAMAVVLVILGDLTLEQGDATAARAYMQEALSLGRDTHSLLHIIVALCHLGDLERGRGNYATAEAFYREGLTLNEEYGDWWMRARLLRGLGIVAQATNEFARAKQLFAESLALSQQYGYLLWIAESLTAVAGLTTQLGSPRRAVKLLGAADTLFKKIQIVPVSFVALELQRTLAAVRGQLDADAFNPAWEEGQSLSLEQAIALALEND